ncbi:shiftless antiviral inhibitor of ribosomal frameshifting protein homolog [Physella acuta]|uniref:shiftless antiviral inhibitor of ribosomal frameshifting protein homolog n=1 Tax=Physella acuta TaxID=109671 RepID=UPI0027DB81E0|nr:shiftless antiviral inhibitor of ribosomal frameshifting protein homolog [Physella acuta]
MADEEDGNDNSENNARRFRELFRGRFTQEDAVRIVRGFEDLRDAVIFFLTASPEQVREFLGQDQDYQAHLMDDADSVMSILDSDLQQGTSDRLFACRHCVRSWWKKVPNRKMVSTCRGCDRKLEAIPRDKEWGWGRFECQNIHCRNVFYGVGVMGMTKSLCHKCNLPAPIVEVIPPKLREKTRGPDNHDCNGVNCYNGYNRNNPVPYRNNRPDPALNDIRRRVEITNSNGRGREGKPAVCIHKRSDRPDASRVRTWSQVHISSGSTVTTCIDQGSLNTGTGSFAYTMETID